MYHTCNQHGAHAHERDACSEQPGMLSDYGAKDAGGAGGELHAQRHGNLVCGCVCVEG